MTEHTLFAEERREYILQLLDKNSRVLVSDLTKQLGVSPTTLRYDLRVLEEKGLLRRTHGGAVSLDSSIGEAPADTARGIDASAKEEIAKRAVEFVHSGDVIFCDSGSTTTEFVRQITGISKLTIITNDLTIASLAESRHPDWSIITLGGVLRSGFHYSTGAMTITQAESFNANTAFLATSAFSFKKGFSTHSTDIAEYKRKLIENSERTIMLMDASKIDKVAMVSFAHLDDITTLVTDSSIEDSDRERFLSSDDAPNLVIA